MEPTYTLIDEMRDDAIARRRAETLDAICKTDAYYAYVRSVAEEYRIDGTYGESATEADITPEDAAAYKAASDGSARAYQDLARLCFRTHGDARITDVIARAIREARAIANDANGKNA